MADFTRRDHRGTGPGAFTPDGCSVELYGVLPDLGESAVITAAAPGGGTLLELGCGAGRMTRPLRDHGFRITAVDESAPMLAVAGALEGVATVRAAIEELDLGERFDVVTLASFLVNTADPVLRGRLLTTCARHLAPGGQVLLQREPDDRNRTRRAGDTVSSAGVTVTVVEMEPVGKGVWRKSVRYDCAGRRWTQTYYARELTTAAFEEALAAAGLAADAYLTDDGSWVRAVAARP